jgi:hypothetical protein
LRQDRCDARRKDRCDGYFGLRASVIASSAAAVVVVTGAMAYGMSQLPHED